MRKQLTSLFFVVGLLAAVAVPAFTGAGPAEAKVHAIAQAGCAHDLTKSGAIQSGDNSPAGPIPVTVSPFDLGTFPGQGGDGDPQCDTPATDERQD